MAIITLNNNSLSGVTALPAGVGGKVLQVVTATDSTDRSTTSTSFVTASNTLSVSITPSSTSSKIFVIVSMCVYGRGDFTIFRDATNLEAVANAGLATNEDNMTNVVCMSILDLPSTTSATTYQVYFRFRNDVTYININRKSSITAYEIAG